ncbi:MAG: flippase-like domain-containing protein [Actinomycetota bacterium]|nr:flippase-like domain-containing protein [Actinomycetota bacterium]
MSLHPVFADLGDFFDAVDKFFSSLAHIRWGSLLLGLLCFGVFLTLRSRAAYNVLRAAYPAERFAWRRIWGAYVAAYGVNNIFPVRPGNVVRLFLTKASIPNSSYPAVASSFLVDNVFDLAIAIPVLIFAFTQGVFPKPPDFSKLNAFDLSYLASHPRFTLFLLTLLAVLVLVAFALLSVRVKAFWARVRQGLTILTDRRRYLREVVAIQATAWLVRFVAFWFLLEAFNVGGSVRNVLLVYGVAAVSSLVPLTPGGAGVQQALLVKVFAGTASSATIAAYSVGQQLAIATFSAGLGLAALIAIFRIRSFREVIRRGREDARAAEAAAP